MRHPLAKHPLAGAYARIDRADIHFKELETILQRFYKIKEDQFFSQMDRVSEKVPLDMRVGIGTKARSVQPVPIEAAAVAGEIFYNLRSALDYLIYELACFNFPGVAHNGTQFIIKHSKADTKSPSGKTIRGFDSESRTRLKGLLKHQIAAIEDSQPYNGVTWTQTLRDLSNPDKHRKLNTIAGEWQGSYIVEAGTAENFERRSGETLPGTGMGSADLHVERKHAVSIEFEDGSPVLKTLEILKCEVRAVIDGFKPEFK
jgi:hypothetical protein